MLNILPAPAGERDHPSVSRIGRPIGGDGLIAGQIPAVVEVVVQGVLRAKEIEPVATATIQRPDVPQDDACAPGILGVIQETGMGPVRRDLGQFRFAARRGITAGPAPPTKLSACMGDTW